LRAAGSTLRGSCPAARRPRARPRRGRRRNYRPR
jgi:hypothetical protein